MREKKMFAQRTRTRNTDETKRKYFLVYVRSYSEEGWSNPKKIVDRMLLNLEESRLGVVSYETLLN